MAGCRVRDSDHGVCASSLFEAWILENWRIGIRWCFGSLSCEIIFGEQLNIHLLSIVPFLGRCLLSDKEVIMHCPPMHYAICKFWALHRLPSWGTMKTHALLKLCNTTLCIITYSTGVLSSRRTSWGISAEKTGAYVHICASTFLLQYNLTTEALFRWLAAAALTFNHKLFKFSTPILATILWKF